MRVFTLGVGVLILSALITFSTPAVYAEESDETESQTVTTNNNEELSTNILSFEKQSMLTFEEWLELQEEADETDTDLPEDVPEPVEHEVEEGDTLIKIADEFSIDWIRIWEKNTELEHPDKLEIGEVLIIPFEEEELEERSLPVVEVPQETSTPASTTQVSSNTTPAPQQQQQVTTQTTAPRGSSSGNLYTAGYCTWYVKNRRPDLPNNLGNADTWASRARSQGLPTGSQPRVGAVGQQGMHVVYVESVNGDGTVTVSEMNWKGLYVTSTRTVPASNFTYIY